ncbi:MAG: UbiX family flavin prenyltransferase [Nitrospinota bacterium]|nr:UbiX family flavin prenyltransferase [Nitrospinota bacterium]
MTATNRWIVIGVSGASGVIYGIRLLEWFSQNPASGLKTRLVMTPSAARNIEIETDYQPGDVAAMADVSERFDNLTAPISSGSFRTEGMVVAPCTMRTLSDIANCNAHNLLVRAADVTLKEGRKLVLVPRETPLHKGHLRLLTLAADMGAVILPPMPAFYHKPKSVDDIVNQTVGKILDQFGVENSMFTRWEG